MSARTRQAWSTLKARIRRLLRETTAATSFWDDDLLLDAWNDAMEARAAEMAEAHEGWTKQSFLADTVANQREYSLPEGIERLLGVWLRYEDGGQLREIALNRDDRLSEDYHESSNQTAGWSGSRPTYRAVDNLLYLEPPVTEARTDGLRLEADVQPARFTGDASKLSLFFPITTETLLVYDTWSILTGIEDSQGNDANAAMNRVDMFHQRLQARWADMIQVRNQSRVYGRGNYFGD